MRQLTAILRVLPVICVFYSIRVHNNFFLYLGAAFAAVFLAIKIITPLREQ